MMDASRPLVLWLFLAGKVVAAILVTVKQGILDGGVEYTSRNGTRFYGFLGIPFAKPPVGELRFEPPQEPDVWDGVRDAKEQPPFCTQVYRYFPSTEKIVLGQEDCLYLNVFTPSVNASELLPVMVFVYGGAFAAGAARLYEPEYFLDHGIVFVPIQHRHAVFGFLSTGDEVLPGNYGMKDQVAALKWVQQNIAAFGGDPNRVTIAGYSSGAMSAHLHMHSALSSGLFQRAVCCSGTSLTLGVVTPAQTARERAQALGTLAGCDELDSKKLVECLRKVPMHELASALFNFYVIDMFPKYPFGIVVEPETVPGAFLVKNPWQQKVINRVPLLIGGTADEGALFASRFLRLPSMIDELNAHAERLLPVVFQYSNRMIGPASTALMTEAVKKFYFDNENISVENINKMVKLFSDCHYDFGSIEATRRYFNEQNEMPIYYFLYGHRNNHSLSEIWLNSTENIGVCHADNFIGFFPRRMFFPDVAGRDLEVSKRQIEYFVNFMYYGDPNGDRSRKVWLPIRSSNFEYLNMSTEMDVMADNLRCDRYNFWKDLYALTFPEYFHDWKNIKTEL